MASSRCAQDTILTDEQLLHTICGTDLRNLLNHFRIEVAPIAANDEEGAFRALRDGEED